MIALIFIKLKEGLGFLIDLASYAIPVGGQKEV